MDITLSGIVIFFAAAKNETFPILLMPSGIMIL